MTSQDDQMRVILLEAGLNTRQRGRTVMARSIVLLVLKFIKVENHLLLSMAVPIQDKQKDVGKCRDRYYKWLAPK
jgi:hypothetical protein